MQDNIPDALIAAFERHYDFPWNEPTLRNERLAWRAAWAEATKPCLHQIQEPAPVQPAQPAMTAALFSARGALQHLKEGGKPTESLLNEAIAAIDSVAISEAAPAAVAVPMAEAWELSAVDVEQRTGGVGQDYNQGLAEGMRTCAKDLRAALAATPAAVQTHAEAAAALCINSALTRIRAGNYDEAIEPLEHALRALAAAPSAAAPVVLPDPVGTLHCNDECYVWARASEAGQRMRFEQPIALFTEQQVRALLATGGQAQAVPLKLIEAINTACGGNEWQGDAVVTDLLDPACRAIESLEPQAQAVERGEVLVTVSGFTGSGKSAIAGEIEILCRALGLQVEWPDGDSEKNMTHADWTAALEQYKPRVHIVEQNIPFAAMKGMSK